MTIQTKDNSLLYFFLLLAFLFLMTSCSAEKKFVKLFQEGNTQKQAFITKIPFEYRLGLIIIKVELNNKTYDFVLDSGGVNLLSKELAETLGKKGFITKNVGGHQGNSQPMDFTKVEELTIGGIKFAETAAGIGDFKHSLELGCIKLDGMIGANLMRLAVWEIDFKNQIITITNTKESLSLSTQIKRIPFYTDAVNKPYCTIKINELAEKNVNIDLGSVQGFNLSYDNYERSQKELSKNKQAIEYGYPSSGYYGYGKVDTNYYLQVDRFSMGEIELDNQLLKFSKSVNPTIGTAFFKNYDLVMNWADKEILLTPHIEYDNQQLIHKGVTLNNQDGALSIASLFKESQAEKLGLKVGDKIIQMDGKDYANITEEAYCDFILQYNVNSQTTNIVVDRNGEQLSFDLKNEIIIE